MIEWFNKARETGTFTLRMNGYICKFDNPQSVVGISEALPLKLKQNGRVREGRQGPSDLPKSATGNLRLYGLN